ncbi:NUDIX hydrolase [Microbacterium sp.]|uniref:NUDIX hydrolase n=1 Tax=Microbacterium sp. TaxID=51671 RepID=UPI001ACFAEC0|nr:NUDIX hydrolase [Microbacterium sp.]MBN9156247.1 NUDIX hydrolase [Microbacterium sp.]
MSSAEDDDLPVAGTAVILRDAADGIEVLLLRRPDRGSFAGAWVFPGGMVEPEDRIAGADESEDAGRAAVRETAEEVGLALERLALLSCWVPPPGIPKRVRTWFFVAADPGGAIRPALDEVVETRWLTPEAALAARDAGKIALMPPTWRTLHALQGTTRVEHALARVGDAVLFRTRATPTKAGMLLFWDGDELAGAPQGARERLIAEDPVWRFEGP